MPTKKLEPIQKEEVVVECESHLVDYIERPVDVLCNDCGISNATAVEIVPRGIIDIVSEPVDLASDRGKKVITALWKQLKHRIGVCRDCSLNASIMEGPVRF